MTVYLVVAGAEGTDGNSVILQKGRGSAPDLCGVFSTSEQAQAWIDRQRPHANKVFGPFTIEAIVVDEAEDLA